MKGPPFVPAIPHHFLCCPSIKQRQFSVGILNAHQILGFGYFSKKKIPMSRCSTSALACHLNFENNFILNTKKFVSNKPLYVSFCITPVNKLFFSSMFCKSRDIEILWTCA
jgi:hypothetical protein